MYKRSRKFKDESINWLENYVAPKLPTWMLTVIKKTDSLLDRGYKKYIQMMNVPHFTKFIWAITLLVLGVSGFCVSELSINSRRSARLVYFRAFLCCVSASRS